MKKIEKKLINYFKKNYQSIKKLKKIPMNKSLVELGYLDSFAVIDLITFIEKEWSIVIDNEDVSREKMGSINKMIKLISNKIKMQEG
tara:strand:+ start:427 stop:687 length:261 start_codon:yes stop_codon:yes gene_type:complete